MAAEEATKVEVHKWKLLPANISDEFQPDPLTGEQYICLAKAINRPKFMLELLHQILFKQNALLRDQNRCAQYYYPLFVLNRAIILALRLSHLWLNSYL